MAQATTARQGQDSSEHRCSAATTEQRGAPRGTHLSTAAGCRSRRCASVCSGAPLQAPAPAPPAGTPPAAWRGRRPADPAAPHAAAASAKAGPAALVRTLKGCAAWTLHVQTRFASRVQESDRGPRARALPPHLLAAAPRGRASAAPRCQAGGSQAGALPPREQAAAGAAAAGGAWAGATAAQAQGERHCAGQAPRRALKASRSLCQAM